MLCPPSGWVGQLEQTIRCQPCPRLPYQNRCTYPWSPWSATVCHPSHCPSKRCCLCGMHCPQCCHCCSIIDFECLLLSFELGAVYFFIDFLLAVQFYDLILLVDLLGTRGSLHWCFLHLVAVMDGFVLLVAFKVVKCLGGHVFLSLILLP
jgi:hypothetical protein